MKFPCNCEAGFWQGHCVCCGKALGDKMDEDDGQERGDETPRWPPLCSPEWERRMRQASADLRRAEREIHEHCASINSAVTKIFRELEGT